METIILGVIVINVIITIILLSKKSTNKESKLELTPFIKELADVKEDLIKNMSDHSRESNKDLNEFKDSVLEVINKNSKETMKDLSEFKEDINKLNNDNSKELNINLNNFKEGITKLNTENSSKLNSSFTNFKETTTNTTNTHSKNLTNSLNEFKEEISRLNNDNSKKLNISFTNFKETTTDTTNEHSRTLTKNLSTFKESIYKNIDEQMEKINKKVELRLDEGFKKTNLTFNNVLERLTKIDEAQKQIEKLSTNIVSLQDVLGDKKTRGIFGEIQLKQILSSIFGDNNTKIYEIQKKLSNDKVADAILHAPEPLGNISIDSKFPLENYKRMVDKTLSNSERDVASGLFVSDLKKHIDAISSKYIIPGETSDQAILFLPAEAIFAEIHAYHPKIVEYSQKHKVWLTSPTTLMSTLTTIQVLLNNMERDKHAAVIQRELNKLGVEFKRYKERWNKLERSINTVTNSVKEINTTSNKISKRFEDISKVDLIEIENKEIENN